ncbi:MAG TPA: hypothetical protein VM263_12540, partial [Acidimicrobiales bacterium]|nr:hypothetical protein [Acidimicrobiales bacterium]
MALLRHRFGSVVVDLSMTSDSEATAYLAALPDHVRRQRESTGVPHWILVDEAQRPTPLGPSGAGHGFLSQERGMCLATFEPLALWAEVYETVDYARPGWGPAAGGRARRATVRDLTELLRQAAPLGKGRATRTPLS